MDNLPIYEMVCTGQEVDKGLAAVALVDDPAIQQHFLMFKNAVPMAFAVTDAEQRIITGPVMIPDMPLMRNQPLKEGGEPVKFMTFASKETVANTCKMFSRNGKLSSVNIMHESDLVPENVFLFESWISDSAKGKPNPIGFEHLPDGTWFMSFICDNDAVWTAAKDGKLNGFSLQAVWGLKAMQFRNDEDALIDELTEVFQKIKDSGAIAI